jgi:hypothetical protein
LTPTDSSFEYDIESERKLSDPFVSSIPWGFVFVERQYQPRKDERVESWAHPIVKSDPKSSRDVEVEKEKSYRVSPG